METEEEEIMFYSSRFIHNIGPLNKKEKIVVIIMLLAFIPVILNGVFFDNETLDFISNVIVLILISGSVLIAFSYFFHAIFFKDRSNDITQQELDAHELASREFVVPLGIGLKKKKTGETSRFFATFDDLFREEREIFEWKHDEPRNPADELLIEDWWVHEDYELIEKRPDGAINVIKEK